MGFWPPWAPCTGPSLLRKRRPASGPLTPGMCRGPATKTRDDEDVPSPQHYFQRSVTLPAMMEDEGREMCVCVFVFFR